MDLGRLLERLRLGCLAAATALVVVTPLMPSEAVANFGVNAPTTMGWLVLLLLWSLLAPLSRAAHAPWSWADGWLLALGAWHSLAGIIAMYSGSPRPALNVTWLWIGYLAGYWVLRQWLATDVERRALVAVLLAVSVVQASHGLYQYFYSNPQTRAAYARDPESIMRRAGVAFLPGTPEADQFRNRIESKEPIASFGLANSLAGLITPWMVIASGMAISLLRSPERSYRALAALLATLLILATCLFLTKSRTGVLAVATGIALLVAAVRLRGLKVSWKVTALASAGVVAVIALALAARGLDRLVLTEAPKSLQYRLEYWRATAAMIAEHPLLGVGPGNFQDWYPRYKLPQASETIADPHNYWLEMAATAGIPAALLLLGWHVALGLQFLRGGRQSVEATTAAPPDERVDLASRLAIYIGFALGMCLLLPFDMLVSFVPEGVEWLGDFPVAWVIGGPLAALLLAALDGWVCEGELPPYLAGIGLATLAINLLAAGALFFPGVMTSAWVLAALAPAVASPGALRSPRARSWAWGGTALAAALVILAYRTLYTPVLEAQGAQYDYLEAHASDQPARAAKALQQWIAVDPWAALPWQYQAELNLSLWLADGDEDRREAFLRSADEFARRSAGSSRNFEQRAQWNWTAWRRRQDAECRDRAVALWRGASERYPSSGYLHAQLACVLSETGHSEEARDQAQRALALDERNPHREQKLARRRLFDPGTDSDSPYRPESAEETLRALLEK